jgi:hypothetical protein
MASNASNSLPKLAYPPVGGVNIIRATHAIKASYLDPFHKACSSTVKHLVNHLFRGDGVTLGPKAPKLRWIARPDEFFISVSVTIRSVEWTLPQKICLFPQIIPASTRYFLMLRPYIERIFNARL